MSDSIEILIDPADYNPEETGEKAVPGQSKTAEKEVKELPKEMGFLRMTFPMVRPAATQSNDIQNINEELPGAAAADDREAPILLGLMVEMIWDHPKVFVGLRSHRKKYTRKGLLYRKGIDLCDCLQIECSGCLKPCRSCNSKKCGPTCRRNRKWVYTRIEDQFGNLIRTFPFPIRK